MQRDVAMSTVLQRLLAIKPSGIPNWVYYCLLSALLVAVGVVIISGFWFASTQIEFM
jgi:hypothetical protein